MSTGKVGVIRKDDPASYWPLAAMLGGAFAGAGYLDYQGSDVQRRNQQRWKAAQAEGRRLGRGVKRIAQLPGRAAQGAAQGVKRLGYELSGDAYRTKPDTPDWQTPPWRQPHGEYAIDPIAGERYVTEGVQSR